MTRPSWHVSLALVVLAADVCAVADEKRGDDELGQLSLEELMHVDVHAPALAPQPPATAPSIVSVISSEQIRALGLRTLDQAVKLLPGVTVLETATGLQRFVIRGQDNANDILVTLDGERLNDFYDGNFLTHLPLENVERIELIRGPGSALYGTNAYAGIIAIFSRTPAREVRYGLGGLLSVDHSVGGGVRAHLKIAHSWRSFNVQVFGSYWEDSGPRVLVTRDDSDPSYTRAPGETNGARRVALAQLTLRKDGVLTGRDSLELWSAFLYRRIEPYFGAFNVFATDASLARSAFLARLTYRVPFGAGLSAQHAFHFDRRDANNLLQDEPPGYFHEVDGNFTREPGEVFPDGMFRRYSYVTYRLAQSGQIEWSVHPRRGIVANQLIAGGLFEYEWLPAFDYGQNFCCGSNFVVAPSLQNWDDLPFSQLDKDRLTAAAFVHDQLQPRKWLWITAGLRLDWYSDFGSTWNPRVAVVARPHRKISFKLLYGTAFRAPSFRDLYDQTGASETAGGLFIHGNPSLRPEKTQTAETGFETTPWRPLTLRANGFYIETSDTIDVDTTFTLGGAKVINFPGRRIWGGEAEAQLHLDEANYLAVNLSYFESTQLGTGLPGWESDAERRFIDTRLEDLPKLRLNAFAVAEPLARLSLPATLSRIVVALRYHYVSALANNNRFTFEALSVFRQPEYHELAGNLIVPFAGGRIELDTSFELAFGRTIAVPLTTGFYDLPSSAATLFLGVRARE